MAILRDTNRINFDFMVKTKPLTSLANEIELTTQVAEGNLADYIIALQGYFREQEDSFINYFIKKSKELSKIKPVNPDKETGIKTPANRKLHSFIKGFDWGRKSEDLISILKYINYNTTPFGIDNAVTIINRVAKIKERKEKASLSGIVEYANTPRFAVDTRDYILKQRTQFLREAAQISKNIDWQTSNRIYWQLYKGVENLESIRDMSVRVADVFDGCTQNRAVMIARTETLRSFNTATIDSYKMAGIANAQFIVAQDERTCDTCLSLSGLIVPVSEARGSLPIHPQCRCTWIAVIGRPLIAEPQAGTLGWFRANYPESSLLRSIKPVGIPKFKPAKTRKAAEKWAEQNLGVKVSGYEKVEMEFINEMHKQLLDIKKKFPSAIDNMSRINVRKNIVIGGKKCYADVRGYSNQWGNFSLNINSSDIYDLKSLKKAGGRFYGMSCKVDKVNELKYIIHHESGHLTYFGYKSPMFVQDLPKGYGEFEGKLRKLKARYESELITLRNDWRYERISMSEFYKYHDKLFISHYADKNTDEFFAECFAQANLSSHPTKYALEVMKALKIFLKS